MTLSVKWIDRGREPQCPPNPAHPKGIDIDQSRGQVAVCETTQTLMIGECETCGRQNVPVAKVNGFACETVACFICQGDVADPYCELVTDWEDVEQRENVTCVTCQEKLWACRCEDPDVDEQRR